MSKRMSTKREALYRKIIKEFWKMAEELNTFYGAEIASVFYSNYDNKPVVYPNYADATKTFQRFRASSVQKQFENVVTQEESGEQRIKKLKEELQKIREENKFKKLTNKVLALKVEDISLDMDPVELNDLSYVIKENLKQVWDVMKAKASEEGSTSNTP